MTTLRKLVSLATAAIMLLGLCAGMTLSAETKTYTAKFMDNLGTSTTVAQVSGTVGQSITIPSAVPDKHVGYRFTGWTEGGITGGTVYKAGDTYKYESEGIIVFTANFVLENWVAMFDSNLKEATGTMATITIAAAGTFTFPACGYTAARHDFAGWKIVGTGKLDANATAEDKWTPASDTLYKAGDEIKNVSANLQIAAQWTAKAGSKWIVTLNPGLSPEGSPAKLGTEYEDGATLEVSKIPNIYVNEGYTFIGWAIGNKFYPLNSTETVTMHDDVMLVAQWAASTSSAATSSATSSAASSAVKSSTATSSKTTSSKVTTSSKTSSAVSPSSVTSSVVSGASVSELSDATGKIVLNGKFGAATTVNAQAITAATAGNTYAAKLLSSTLVQQLAAYDISLSSGSILSAGKLRISLTLPSVTSDTAVVTYHFITAAEYVMLGEMPDSPVFIKQADGSYAAETADGSLMACPFTLDDFIITEVSDGISAKLLSGAFKLDDGSYVLYFIQKYHAGDTISDAIADYSGLSPFAVTSAKLTLTASEPTSSQSGGNGSTLAIVGICVAVVAAVVIVIVLMAARKPAKKRDRSVLDSDYGDDDDDDENKKK